MSVDHSWNQVEFVAHLADGLVDLLVDHVVEALAPPFVGDQRLVVELGEAGFEALQGEGLDGPAEGHLVLRLAGLVVRTRQGRLGAQRAAAAWAIRTAAAVRQETAERKRRALRMRLLDGQLRPSIGPAKQCRHDNVGIAGRFAQS